MSQTFYDGRYYALGRDVFRSPIESATGIRMGFLVCSLGENVLIEGAQEIADALNQAEDSTKSD